MKVFDSVKNFFREDYSDVVGIYYNGDKIFLAHATHKIEIEEINFEIDFNDKVSPIEQLAEKIFMILNQRGWKNSKIALCLNDDDAIIFRTNLDNVPPNEIDSAVKIWAYAQAGNNAPYTYINLGDEIWAETLSKTIVSNYISAYKKNSLNLCALSAMPTPADDDNDRAIFIAEILSENKSPNLLAVELINYNLNKIYYAATAIFLFALILFSAKLFYDYRVAYNELESAKKILSAQSELLVLKKNLDNNISEMKKINSLIDSQADKFSKLNIFIRLGKIPDNSVRLKKIFAAADVIQIDGVADNPTDIENFRRNLDNSALENSATVDGAINFSIKIFLR